MLSLASRTWRLPSKQELDPLPDYSRSNPAIDTTAFPATFPDFYWSSTTYAPNPARAWGVGFGEGAVSIGPKSFDVIYVRCVSGQSKEYSSSFTNNNDGTVKDNATGLVWQKCSQGLSGTSCGSGTASTANWSTAIGYCTGLTLAGRTWRLPTINELKTIVDTTKAIGAAIDTDIFPATVANGYWSSTTNAPSTANAWGVDFNSGDVLDNTKSVIYYVRCVSGP